jgi:hypothetical protein
MTHGPLGPVDGSNNKSSDKAKAIRAILNTAGGLVPFAGGLFSAAAGFWSETEQERAMDALRAWMKMLEDEMREKQRTIIDIVARLDMHDEQISERVRSAEYQSLLKKAFRNWAGTESKKKQEYIRNILSNAATTRIVSDDVVSLFIEWLHNYSEFHFSVIGHLYHHPGSTRGDVWDDLGRGPVREDSADADLFKLLVRDLSTGGIIRQHRDTDYEGKFLARQRPKPAARNGGARVAKSAFDDTEAYELTALGRQFVHYAMTEVTIKIAYRPDIDDTEDETVDVKASSDPSTSSS